MNTDIYERYSALFDALPIEKQAVELLELAQAILCMKQKPQTAIALRPERFERMPFGEQCGILDSLARAAGVTEGKLPINPFAELVPA